MEKGEKEKRRKGEREKREVMKGKTMKIYMYEEGKEVRCEGRREKWRKR